MSAASRQARRRERVRQGEVVYRIGVPCDALAKYLIGAGRVSEVAAADHAHVEQALRQVVIDLVERWRHA